MLSIEVEAMSRDFTKFRIDGLPNACVLHHFTAVDRGDPHDHPWGFRSFILFGGYTEEVFDLDGNSRFIDRAPGDSFTIEARHIHRIVALPQGECWTVVLPGPTEQVSGFWQFRDGLAFYRPWHEQQWRPVSG